MDGPWQMGYKTAEEYARVAEETARAMRRVDDTLELVACGSSNRGMPTFGTWERVVLERCFDLVDHISAHAYYEPVDGDADSFLASGEDMHRFIESVVATADHVAAVRGATSGSWSPSTSGTCGSRTASTPRARSRSVRPPSSSRTSPT